MQSSSGSQQDEARRQQSGSLVERLQLRAEVGDVEIHDVDVHLAAPCAGEGDLRGHSAAAGGVKSARAPEELLAEIQNLRNRFHCKGPLVLSCSTLFGHSVLQLRK